MRALPGKDGLTKLVAEQTRVEGYKDSRCYHFPNNGCYGEEFVHLTLNGASDIIHAKREEAKKVLSALIKQGNYNKSPFKSVFIATVIGPMRDDRFRKKVTKQNKPGLIPAHSPLPYLGEA